MSTRFQGLVKILKLMFNCSGKFLKLMFGHYFATDMMLGVVMKFNLGRDCEARFGQDF